MPSEHRLHPASILFEFGGLLRRFAVPGLLVLFTAGRTSGGTGHFQYLPSNWEVWMMLLIVPNMFVSLARYWSFRIRYAESELVIRSGILFRNVRHVPYARIQNLDAAQNLLQRALGVVEVRVQTGGGREPEATMSVLSVAAFTQMRDRVSFERTMAGAAGAERPAEPEDAEPSPSRVLLHLDPRALLLRGFIENRGMLVIGAAYGLLWNAGVLEGFWDRAFDDDLPGRGALREAVTAMVGEGRSARGILLAAAGLLAVLLLVRFLSMGWALVRLYDFRLTRSKDDLRTEYGLLTRVATTVPLRRVQTLTAHEGPWHRLLARVSVRVETAGGGETGAGTRQREWLAPILDRSALPALVREVLPEADLEALAWQKAHPRAVRRAVKPRLALALVASVAAGGLLGWGALVVLVLAASWAVLAAHAYVSHLGWAVTDDVVAFRSGWITRRTTVARVGRIQAIGVHESPFDRRTIMARLRVDTAGAGPDSHRIDIPYLPRDAAHAVGRRLAAEAGNAAFRW